MDVLGQRGLSRTGDCPWPAVDCILCWSCAVQIDDKRLLVFGGLDKRSRYNDAWLFHTDSKNWEQLQVQGPCPEPRAHFTATKVGSKVYLFGGYGSSGQVFNDLWALSTGADAASFSWEDLSSQLQGDGPSPRFDHAAYVYPITPNSPSYDRLVVAGGRDLSAALLDSFMLDLARLNWLPEAPALPLDACNSICDGVSSVPFHKVFNFGGKRGMMNYLNSVEVMDCGNQTWNTPVVQGSGKPPCGRCAARATSHLPAGHVIYPAVPPCECSAHPNVRASCLFVPCCSREDTAWAYHVKTSSFLIFGGWASRWLGDLTRLDVSAIIGPPYACTGILNGAAMLSQNPVDLCWTMKLAFTDTRCSLPPVGLLSVASRSVCMSTACALRDPQASVQHPALCLVRPR